MKLQMTKTLGTALYTAAIAAMLGLPASAGEAPMAALQLKALAGTVASAPKREAAKLTRLDAEALDAEVAKQQAAKLARSFGAMSYKWPAMANSYQQEAEKNVQALRSVAERR